MLSSKLVDFFSDFTKIPVEIKTVRDQVLSMSGVDKIFFVPSEINPSVLRGMVDIFDVTPELYAPPERVAVVSYAKELRRDWQRLVCVKELIHVLDIESEMTSTREDLLELVDLIARPVDLHIAPEENGRFRHIQVQYFGDRLAEFQALAILFPRDARSLLMAPYKAGKITNRELAGLARIPERYISTIMHPQWEQFLETLCQNT